MVLGASEHAWRYSNLAVRRLVEQGHPVIAIGRRSGAIGEVPILTQIPAGVEADTVTLYLSPPHQAGWMAAIIDLRPRRVIFNPGTENNALAARLREAGVETLEACTLVLLATGTY